MSPKGKPHKTNAPELPVPKVVGYGSLRKSFETALATELNQIEDEALRKILGEAPGLLDAAVALASGITVQKFTQNGDAVYTVPPYWPAVQYLLNWIRQLIGQGAVNRTEHGMNKDDRKLIQDWIKSGRDGDPPPRSGPDGVFTLGDDAIVEGKVVVDAEDTPVD